MEILMDEIMRMQDVIKELEEKVSNFEKNELFMQNQASLLNNKIERLEREKKQYNERILKLEKEVSTMHEYKRAMQQQKLQHLLSSQTDVIAGSLTKGALFDTLKNIITAQVPDSQQPQNFYMVFTFFTLLFSFCLLVF